VNYEADDYEALNDLLAQLYDLWLLERAVHVEVRGTEFHALHEMVEEFYEDTNDHADELAERLVSKGGSMIRGPEAVAEQSELNRRAAFEYQSEAEQELFKLYHAKQSLLRLCRDLVERFGEDPVMEDVLIEIAREQEFHVYALDQSIGR